MPAEIFEDAKLQPLGDEEAPPISLSKGALWSVGRAAKNEIVVQDQMVSRSHAMIQKAAENEYILIDLGSRNGAYVNDQRVCVPVVLKDGDRITFGRQQFAFVHPLSEQAAAAHEEEHDDNQTRLLYAMQWITVLVVDIRDFTGLSRSLDEALLARTVGTWISKSGAILQRSGSWGQKYIGDAIMAVWVHGSEAHDASRAPLALSALALIVKVTEGLQQQFGLSQPVRIGAGMNSGVASLGNVGSGAASDYTALGDGVNRAFRLEAATRLVDADLLVGPETYSQLSRGSAKMDLFDNLTVALKGYDRPAHCHGLTFDKLPALVASMKAANEGQTAI